MATITAIKNVLTRKFRGASLDDVQGISNYTIFGEAASNLLSEIDPMETVRHAEINLFDNINDYAAPTDLRGKKIIDIRPQVDRSGIEFKHKLTEEFDQDKSVIDEWFSVEHDEGTKFLRIAKDVGYSIGVDTVAATTSWTASGGAANVTTDTILFSEGGISLRFDLGAAGGTMTYAPTSTVVDLSDHESKSSFFRWIYFPDSSIVTSVTLRVGSDSSNYFSMTGVIHRGSIRTGWNLYRFDWNGATETGTADTDNIDYEALIFVTTAADTDIRIGKLFSKLPKPYEIVYYSNALFRPTTGSTWLTQPTADTDIMMLEHEAENVFLYECAVLIAEDLQRDEDAQKFYTHLHGDGQKLGLYGQYKEDKPSESKKPSFTYYKPYRRTLTKVKP